MAVAKLVCGDCSQPIAPTDAFCPSCGAKIERAGQPEQRKPQKQAGAKSAPAKVFEPWQIISGIAVLALVAYLVYSEVSKVVPETLQPPPAASAPAGVPFLSAAAKTIDLTPLEEAVKADPKDAGAILRLANAQHDNRMLPVAIETYKTYLKLRPGDPDARTDLGICYFQLAQTDTANSISLLQTAANEMTEANNNAPNHQPSAFNLGVVYLHLQDMEQSNKWFKRTVELNKDSDLGKRAQNLLNQHGLQPAQ
jgi:tetratricopeptide (TPR) repeat protein